MKRVGSLLVVLGIIALVWVVRTETGGEPVTGFIQHQRQAHLRHELHRASCATHVREGHAVGVLVIPSLGLRQVVVQGVKSGDLSRGPGHYPSTGLPGSGRVVAIAGHRTTWGAPFRHIDNLKPGDAMIFCGHVYHYVGERVVRPSNIGVLYGRHERLVLTTCTPPHSAEFRLVAVAR